MSRGSSLLYDKGNLQQKVQKICVEVLWKACLRAVLWELRIFFKMKHVSGQFFGNLQFYVENKACLRAVRGLRIIFHGQACLRAVRGLRIIFHGQACLRAVRGLRIIFHGQACLRAVLRNKGSIVEGVGNICRSYLCYGYIYIYIFILYIYNTFIKY